jgi:hypothetical protein
VRAARTSRWCMLWTGAQGVNSRTAARPEPAEAKAQA